MSTWTKEHESILKDWKAKAFAYLWLQNNSSYYYIKIYNWLAYTVIVLSSFASAVMFSLNSDNNTCTSSIGLPIVAIQYTVGVITLLAAILTGVIRQLRPGEMYQQHASMAKRYQTLMRSVDACLSLTSTLRPEPTNFIEKAGTELDNLANNQVDPPLAIVKRFEKIFGPLERILYGEDVVELWKLTYKTKKIEAKMKNRDYRSSAEYSAGFTDDDTVIQEVYKTKLYESGDRDQHTNLENIIIKDDSIEITNEVIQEDLKMENSNFVLNNIAEPLKPVVWKAQTFKRV